MIADKKNTVFTIIVTYNSLQNDWIINCLNSLKQSNYETQVVVVDNNSTDGTCSYIKEKHPEVHLIESKDNLGFGKGNNVGIAFAKSKKADYYFLLNQDTKVKSNTIQLLVDAALSNPDFGIISPVHLNYDGSLLEYYFSIFTTENGSPKLYSDLILGEELNSIYEFSFINAACWLIPARVIDTVGGFDPIFKHYGEDNNYCHRIIFHGYKIGVVPKSFLCHDSKKRILNLKNTDYEKHINIYQRNLQVKLGNIEIDYNIEQEYRFERNTIIYNLLSSFLKFQISNVKFELLKLKNIKSIFDEIDQSRQLNMTIGSLYL